MRFDEAQILAAIAGFAWVLLRSAAMFVSMPLFIGHTVPMPVRVMLATGVAFAVLPNLPPMPEVELFSLPGLFVSVQQCLIGAAMGFVLHMVFAAIVFGGQSVAYSMGLGFASLVDPLTGVQVPAIAQVYQLLGTLLFLSMDGHLVMIRLLADSFQAVPVGFEGLGRDALWELSLWTGKLMAAGLLLSLPMVAALLLINLGFGVASRAAPQLNIFSVGFPVSLLLGLVLMRLTLPDVLALFAGFLDEGYRLIGHLLG
ncbi:flagellar biosynthetic protein FliR [Methylomagnum ishizawai]|uniref:Flagellar biosynthetic protein FliR n=1 Tax=Methylomagnum ishizawai TaxID=1760988 RepID=A0A1Y6CSW1_9GAMM|nr:flagellar biosynthetic protein FliR [Methylomagnum ishizawai]SMF93719.1 flagellar biosynthetic protein FliR [Methylomagnum ishizawai]